MGRYARNKPGWHSTARYNWHKAPHVQILPKELPGKYHVSFLARSFCPDATIIDRTLLLTSSILSQMATRVPSWLEEIGVSREEPMYKSVVAELQKIPEIVECHFTTGPYTMLHVRLWRLHLWSGWYRPRKAGLYHGTEKPLPWSYPRICREIWLQICSGLLLAVLTIKPLNLLLFGEEYAVTMGLNIRRSRSLFSQHPHSQKHCHEPE